MNLEKYADTVAAKKMVFLGEIHYDETCIKMDKFVARSMVEKMNGKKMKGVAAKNTTNGSTNAPQP